MRISDWSSDVCSSDLLVSAASGTLLTTIEQIDPIYVNFSQSSSNLLAIRRDITAGRLRFPGLEKLEVELDLQDGTTYGFRGHIDFLDIAINEGPGTEALRAEFPNLGRLPLPGRSNELPVGHEC